MAKKRPNTISTKGNTLASQGKSLLQASYGKQATANGTPAASTAGVMDYYKSLSMPERKAGYRDLARAANTRTNGLTGVLYGDLPTAARVAYQHAKTMNGVTSASIASTSQGLVAPWENTDFSGGVSATPLGAAAKGGGGGKKKGKKSKNRSKGRHTVRPLGSE